MGTVFRRQRNCSWIGGDSLRIHESDLQLVTNTYGIPDDLWMDGFFHAIDRKSDCSLPSSRNNDLRNGFFTRVNPH
jgi:hypothetical protein